MALKTSRPAPRSSTGGASLRVQERVRHATHGDGVVARLLDGGRKALVRFDAQPSMPCVVTVGGLDQLRASAAPVPEPSVVAATRVAPGAQRPAVTHGDRHGDRQALEALRMGVVPASGLDEITVGRQEERAQVHALLASGRGMRVLSGGYGSGKTHMIELAEAAALKQGFVVARATFDPVEVPPSHPLRLYGALTRQLQVPQGGDRGLSSVLARLGDSQPHLVGDRQHRWLSPALFALHHAPPVLAQDVIDFVSGQCRDDHVALYRQLRRLGFRGQPMLGLPDYRTFGQIMAHLLGGLACWARDAGWRGLVVLLDEAEYLDRLGSTSRDMAEKVLRYLAVAAVNRSDLAFDPDALYRGGQAAHRRISPHFEVDQPLIVLCAFTPDPQVDRVLERTLLDPSTRVTLDPVRPSLLPVLAEKIYGLIKAVYPQLDPQPLHRRRVTRALQQAFASGQINSTRQAARLVVEFWDLYRLDPQRALRALHGEA